MSNQNDYVEVTMLNDSIVIRIPDQYLSKIATPAAFDGINGYEDAKVVNDEQLVEDVVGELNREAEDGTTKVHLMLDDAIRAAYDNGSEAFEG